MTTTGHMADDVGTCNPILVHHATCQFRQYYIRKIWWIIAVYFLSFQYAMNSDIPKRLQIVFSVNDSSLFDFDT